MKHIWITFIITCAALLTYTNISAATMNEPEPEASAHAIMEIEIMAYETAVIPDEPEALVEAPEAWELNSLGEFRITVYTPHCDGGKWGYQTATGAKSEHLATCAVDPEIIPLGSVIHINGLELRAVDTGSAVKGNVIDIFCDSTQAEARRWVQEFGTSHEVRTWEN